LGQKIKVNLQRKHIMKLLKLTLKFFWKLKTVILTGVLLVSLGLNLILFLGGSLYSMVNSGFEVATGVRTIATRNKAQIANLGDNLVLERKAKRELKSELTETSGELVTERAMKRELKGQVTELSGDLVIERKMKRELKSELAETSGELVTERVVKRELKGQVKELSGELVVERKIKRKLKSELAEGSAKLAVERITQRTLKSQIRDLTAGLVPFGGKKVALRTAVEATADKIGKRSVKSATRNVSSMPGEAIPWLGTAVIAGVTALELYDLCETMKDMTELKRAFDPTLTTNADELEVCAIKVPPKEEIIEAVKNSPEMAWKQAKSLTPSLGELKAMEMPEIDLENIWNNAADSTKSLSEKLKNYWNQ
jgi:hypothetical protein